MNNSTHRPHRLRWRPLALRWFAIVALSADTLGISAIVESAERPNFLVIMCDDLGWTGTSVQMDPNVPFSKSDYHQTPNLEQMANEGMRFSNAYSGGPVCSPGRSAFLTGRSAAQLHQTDTVSPDLSNTHFGQSSTPPISLHLLDEYTTLPERLKQFAPEYSTALLRGNHSGSEPLNYGFDVYDFYSAAYRPEGENPVGLFSTANHANAFMEEKVQSDNPFFLMVAPTAIHTPIEYTAESFAIADARPRGVRHRNPAVAAELLDLDNSIGQMFDKINQLGIADNTYIIFTSDNGGTAGARINEPLFGAKGTLYEGGIRVPMIVKGPGIAPNSVSSVPISGTDFSKTISDLAGITAPYENDLESASLVPLFQNGGQLPEGEALQRGYGTSGELFFHFPHHSGFTSPASAVRDGDFKLVKLHGQAGGTDSIFLYNLANNITETNNLSSPLNLATSMPTKTAELAAKLDGWLDEVDASMPHQITTNAHLLWDATNVGSYESLWRSKNRVKDLNRESWQVIPERTDPGFVPESEIAQVVDISPYQPELGNKAFAFDGNDLMARNFFQVSDSASIGAADNSATFEFWLRLSDLEPNKPQILMESGSSSSGLSLTIGDADNNGKSNDLRLRMRSSSGTALSVTAPVDRFANPVEDFIHVAAVVKDVSAGGRLELYINGALASSAFGSSFDWDSTDDAGLGYFSGASVGANGGEGDLPFVGRFEGQLTEMSFYNYALNGSDIQTSYNSKLSPVNAGLSAVSGDAMIPLGRLTNVSLNALNSPQLHVMQERSNVLSSALEVDAVINGGATLANANQAMPGMLTAGTPLSSYLLVFDPASSVGTAQAQGTIFFGEEILGIIFDDDRMALTDTILGTIGNYGDVTTRGLAIGIDGSLVISPNKKSLTFDFEVASNDMLQFRVLTSLVDVPTFLEADFNQSGKVNATDLAIWQDAFGNGPEGDADGDGDTDGRDFLIWQQQFIPPPPAPVFTADFNDDGFVDHDDLLVWQSSYGVNLDADANRDGITDGRDFLIWQREFYDQSSLGLTAVPEPTTCSVLLLFSLAGVALRIRRRAPQRP